MRQLLAVAIMLFAAAAEPATDDSFKVIKLEQDVRNLERQVQGLLREVEQLKSSLGRLPQERGLAPRDTAAAPGPTAASWLEAARWNRIKVGAAELEVIETLGPPTSMRQEGTTRVLLYALEIGAAGFLSGSVRLDDRVVVAIEKPVLK